MSDLELILASNNQHKVEEIRAVLPEGFSIITLKEAGIDIDIPEPHDTLEENAREKALTIYKMAGKSCFSEDTGLEIKALNGEPGVKSARYAGEDRSFKNNIDKVLRKLEGEPDRSARFRTVICLCLHGLEHYFEGICEGQIVADERGGEGFGYDPIFVPDGSDKTFAEMGMEEKNRFSHRSKAVDKLVTFLTTLAKQ